MSATKPALLRAFAESFASPYQNETLKRLPGKKKVPKSKRKLRRKLKQMKAKHCPKKARASSFRYVVQPICSKNPLCLYLNAKFCKDNRLEHNTLVDLTIHDVLENQWVVEFVYRDHSDFKRKAIMLNGFQEFIQNNDLKEGDQLVFHLMPCTLGNTTRPWFQVFIKGRKFCASSKHALQQVGDEVFNHALDQVGDQVLFPEDCNVMNHQALPSPSPAIITSPEGSITQERRPPIQRSYKFVFNGRVVRHFVTLEYNN